MLGLKPDMASLATGSVNFPTSIYENPPDFGRRPGEDHARKRHQAEIEVFDLAMLYNAANLVKKGLLTNPPHVQFVLGIRQRLPVRPQHSSTSCAANSPRCCPAPPGSPPGTSR